ncbi:hypothetical protein CDD83_7495 [Cordyceps sp. RAO-2017]|nr:hypothetical protein CDD83_7495 [Cordyceps sp. RAO-2017]
MQPRKRQRPNPAAAGSSSSRPTTAISREVATSQCAAAAGPNLVPLPPLLRSRRSIAALTARTDEKQIRKAKSWYGSWPRAPTKAAASTCVARENILGGTVRSTRAPDLSRFEPKRGDCDAASRHGTQPVAMPTKGEDSVAEESGDSKHTSKDESAAGAETHEPSDAGAAESQYPATPLRPQTSYSWLGWWSRTPATESQPGSIADATPPRDEPMRDKHQQAAADGPPTTPAPSSDGPPTQASTSWFGLWPSYGDANAKPHNGERQAPSPDDEASREPADVVMTDAPPPRPSTPPPARNREAAPPPKAGSTWAFCR